MLAEATLVAIAAAAIVIAVITHKTNDYLRTVIAATYQLAGDLANQNDIDMAPGEALNDDEFDAGITLLLNTLADPNSPDAEMLVAATPFDSYVLILEKAERVRYLDGCGCKEPDVHPIA